MKRKTDYDILLEKLAMKKISIEEFEAIEKTLPVPPIYDFAGMIEQFLTNKMSVKEFERKYLDTFLEHDGPLPEDLYQILNELFYAVEAYTDLPFMPEDDPEDHINEEQLRESAEEALQKLRAMK